MPDRWLAASAIVVKPIVGGLLLVVAAAGCSGCASVHEGSGGLETLRGLFSGAPKCNEPWVKSTVLRMQRDYLNREAGVTYSEDAQLVGVRTAYRYEALNKANCEAFVQEHGEWVVNVTFNTYLDDDGEGVVVLTVPKDEVDRQAALERFRARWMERNLWEGTSG